MSEMLLSVLMHLLVRIKCTNIVERLGMMASVFTSAPHRIVDSGVHKYNQLRILLIQKYVDRHKYQRRIVVCQVNFS